MKHITRIIIWIVILVTPTAIWFMYTDNGRAAYKDIFSQQQKSILKPKAQQYGQRTLIPVNPPGTVNIKPR